MSGRKDWSALSSLARQRSLEDAEEQQREHRRRHRNLSSTADAAEAPRPAQDRGRPSSVRLPSVEEAEGPTPPSPGSRGEKEDAQAVPRTRQERRQRRQLVEVSQTPVRERLEAEEGRDGSGPGPAEQRPPTPKKEEGAPPRRRLSREQRGPWAREEENLVGGEPGGGQQGVSQRKPSAPEGVGALENRPSARAASSSGSSLLSERAAVSERKKTVLEKTGISEKVPNPRKTSSSERSLVSERTLLFEKSSTPETKLVPKRASGSKQPPPGEQPNPREQPPPWEQHQPREKPQPQEQPKPQEKPQVKIPRKEEEEGTSPSPRATYSSSLQRSSPRTISFRMSPRTNSSETTLTRSASVRLPVKLGEKLERYQSAIQRSESIKALGASRTEFFVAPVGVASKRHLFEKELAGAGRTETAASRKENLKLSGAVTSRLKLWISRTQESREEDPQEVQGESAAARRTPGEKRADSSLDAEV
ncbi:ladinin 1 [Phyllostomus discolor]|uniref:Ladinin 1 n=1 Tax=Phyllostomus discolor TaxID=89673 RepID=A0A833YF94_9CHIR|nr:ladinin 1 [Phyllostomus discolor]